MARILWLFWLGLLLEVAACGSRNVLHAGPPAPAQEDETKSTPLALTSPAFGYGELIPERYTCDGENVSPPLTWGRAPEGTRAWALMMDDPDAPMGTWVHWVLYDLPAETTVLPEGAQGMGTPGRNSWGRNEYGGPCPPPGTPHRYFFRLYALDAPLGLPPGASKKRVEQAMQGHILAQGEWMGRYGR